LDATAPGLTTSTSIGCVADSSKFVDIGSFTNSIEQCMVKALTRGFNYAAIQGNTCKGIFIDTDKKADLDAIKSNSGTCDKKCEFDTS
jgi:hypothetical protein